MAKQPANEVRVPDPEEVVAIGNPESKPKRELPFHLPSGGMTRRQAKARARLEKIVTNPNYSDDARPPTHKLSRGQQKRADYKRRLLREAAKETENVDSK